MRDALTQALRFAAQGISVIPLKARDKRPALASWKEFQSRIATEDEIRGWFASHPDLNVGLVTGSVSGLVVIDADSSEMATRVSAQFPSARRTRTTKGSHFFYRHPGCPVKNRAKIVGLNLDVRGDGGYVVAPGSIHPTGTEYLAEGEWGETSALPIFQPSWLGEVTKPESSKTSIDERIRRYLDRTPGAIQGAGGDAFTFRVACKLVRGYALDDSAALSFLLEWNAKCSPPWSITELQKKVQSARSTGTGEFGYLLGNSPRQETAHPPAAIAIEDGGAGTLQEVLARNEKGLAKRTPGNLAKILRMDPSWGDRLALNEMTRDVLLDGQPQGDHYVDTVQEMIEGRFGLVFSREEIAAKILAQAANRTVHPVREFLQSLPEWDGVERIHRVPAEILHAEEHPIHQHYIRCTLVGAVRRIFHPGTKMDTIPVLVGGQGGFKSTFWRLLCGEQWFGDSPVDLDSKDGPMVLHRSWFTELGEIDHITSLKAAERIKGFASSCQDTFRPPFARSVSVFPRSCVIVGTTNRDRFLNDPTGSRRFWPIKILSPIDLAKLQEWRLQLWAEAVNLFAHGLNHWLDSTQDGIRAEQSQAFEAEDPWEGQFDLAVEAIARGGRIISEGLRIAEIFDQMNVPPTQQNRAASMKLAEILKRKGWERTRTMVGGSKNWRWCPTSPTSAPPVF